jgi:signal transduction histidine kinase
MSPVREAETPTPAAGREAVVLLIAADHAFTQQLIGALARSRGAGGSLSALDYQVPIAANLAQARARLRQVTPQIIVFEESALGAEPQRDGAAPRLAEALEELAQAAPVVLVAAPERQPEVRPLVAAGAVDFVVHAGDFLPLLLGLLERHARSAADSSREDRAARAPRELGASWAAEDLGEVFRHEVNNPLTGILGNAEMLLSRRERLPAAVVQRLEVIADLAVRLRETVRRLSQSWESRAARRSPLGPAPPGERIPSHRTTRSA